MTWQDADREWQRDQLSAARARDRIEGAERAEEARRRGAYMSAVGAVDNMVNDFLSAMKAAGNPGMFTHGRLGYWTTRALPLVAPAHLSDLGDHSYFCTTHVTTKGYWSFEGSASIGPLHSNEWNIYFSSEAELGEQESGRCAGRRIVSLYAVVYPVCAKEIRKHLAGILRSNNVPLPK